MKINDIEIKENFKELVDKNVLGIDIASDIEMLKGKFINIKDRENTKPADDIESAINNVFDFLKKKDVDKYIKVFVKNEYYSKYLGLFFNEAAIIKYLSSPEIYPYNNAIQLFKPLAKFAVFNETTRNFLIHFFNIRQREFWTDAAEALAIAALRDKMTFDFLVEEWNRYYPDGLIISEKSFWEKDVHKKRHILYAISYLVSLKKDNSIVKNFDLSAFTRIGFIESDKDDGSWPSVQIACFEALWDYETAQRDIFEMICCNINGLQKNYWVDKTLRWLYCKVEQHEVYGVALKSAIKEKLLDDSFISDVSKKHDYLAECLIVYLDNIDFLKEKGEINPRNLMLNYNGFMNFLIPVKLDMRHFFSFEQLRNRFIERLKLLLNRNEWHTLKPINQAQCIAELILIAENTEIGSFCLIHFLHTAYDEPLPVDMSKYDNSVKVDAGIIFLIIDILTVTGKNVPRFMFYERTFDEKTTCSLSHIKNGMISIQSAIQVEKILRDKENPCAVIKFLWRLLKADPRPKVYDELLRDLLTENNSLYQIIQSFKELDKLRDNTANGTFDMHSYIKKYRALIKLLIYYINGSKPVLNQENCIENSLLIIDEMLQELNVVLSPLQEKRPIEKLILELNLIIGKGELKVFKFWFESIDMGALNIEWNSFINNYEKIKNNVFIDIETHHEFTNAITDLKSGLEQITWLEFRLVENYFQELYLWADKLKQAYNDSIKINEDIIHLINTNDYKNINNEIGQYTNDTKEVRLLSIVNIQKLYYYLLNNFLIARSLKFRNNKHVKEQIKLPHFLKHISPILFGLIAGPFFVIDFGGAWNVVLNSGNEVAYASVLLASLTVSGLLLNRKFFTKINIIRFTWVFLTFFSFSFLASSLVIMSLNASDLCATYSFFKQAILWSSMSLFFGLLFGLILQGKDGL